MSEPLAPSSLTAPDLPPVRQRDWLAPVLMAVAAAAVLIAGYLTWVSVREAAAPAGCGADSGCARVLASRWSRWFNVPVGAPATALYLAICVAAGLAWRSESPARRRLAWGLLVALAALAAGAAAIAVALLSVRYPSYVSRIVERVGYAGYALPGIVVALALVFFTTRVALPLYQTLAVLVFALAIHYLPLAVSPISASLLQVPPRLEEAARGLGRSPMAVFRTITTPLVTSGVLGGAALVFLHALKELPATLLLAPIGFDTLATDVWRQTSFGFFEASAIPALLLLLIAAPPLYLLSAKGSVGS